jgi:hypothetical protein
MMARTLVWSFPSCDDRTGSLWRREQSTFIYSGEKKKDGKCVHTHKNRETGTKLRYVSITFFFSFGCITLGLWFFFSFHSLVCLFYWTQTDATRSGSLYLKLHFFLFCYYFFFGGGVSFASARFTQLISGFPLGLTTFCFFVIFYTYVFIYIYIKLYTISGMFSSPMPRTGLWRGKVQTHLNKKPVGSSSTERERTAEWLNETTDHVRVSQVFLFYFRCLAERDKKADCEGERQKKLCRLISTCFFSFDSDK